MKRYRRIIAEYFGVERRITELDRFTISEFQQWLLNRKKDTKGNGTLSPATVNRYLEHLKALFTYAYEEGFIDRVPKFRWLHEKGRRNLDITLEDFLTSLSFNKRHRAMLLVALNTGGRATDVFRLTKEQLVTRNVLINGVLVPKSFIRIHSTKTQKENIEIPLLDITETAVNEHLKNNPNTTPFVFINKRTGKPFVKIQKGLNRASERAGIPRYTMHHIRHLATTILFDLTGGDYHMVKNIIGWSDKAMADRYGHLGIRHVGTFDQFNSLIENHITETAGLASSRDVDETRQNNPKRVRRNSRRSKRLQLTKRDEMVEPRGFEPLTFALPVRRSPS